MSNQTSDFWTEERSDFLKENWGVMSSRQIAAYFGDGCTRNAVISKAKRLDLGESPLVTFGKQQQIVRDLRKGRPLASAPKGCQWPLWGPDEKPTHQYCGSDVKPGSSYCAEHHAICYRTDFGTKGEAMATRVPKGVQ